MPDEPMGSGEREREWERCPECGGFGEAIEDTWIEELGEYYTYSVECDRCDGEGTIPVQHDGEGEKQ